MTNTESVKTRHTMSARMRALATRLVMAGLVVPAALVATATTASADTVIIGGPGSYPQPGVVNLSSTGYTGSRELIDFQYCTQYAGAATGSLQSDSFFVFRAAAYSAYRQSISMHVRLDRWNGSAWVQVLWHPAVQTRTTLPGQYPRFDARSFNVASGHVYRVVHVFTWSVNGHVVGQTYDAVNGDAIARGGNNGYVISNTGSAAGFCGFVR